MRTCGAYSADARKPAGAEAGLLGGCSVPATTAAAAQVALAHCMAALWRWCAARLSASTARYASASWLEQHLLPGAQPRPLASPAAAAGAMHGSIIVLIAGAG